MTTDPKSWTPRTQELWNRWEKYGEDEEIEGSVDVPDALTFAADLERELSRYREELAEEKRKVEIRDKSLTIAMNEQQLASKRADELESRLASHAEREGVVSSIDWQQLRGRMADAVDEAINTYDGYMQDDDYDAQAMLDKIIAKLREAREIYGKPAPSAASGLEIRNEIDVRGEVCKIISKMLDNPDSCGIYPTTRCYDELESFIKSYGEICAALRSHQAPVGEEGCPKCGGTGWLHGAQEWTPERMSKGTPYKSVRCECVAKLKQGES